MCEEALADARAVGARAEEGRALMSLGLALNLEGATDEAVECLRQARDIAREVGAEEDVARSAMNLAWVTPDLDESASVALDGLARARGAGLERAFATPLRAIAVNAFVFGGRLAEAWSLAAEPIPPASDVWAEVILLTHRCEVAVLLGEEADARAGLARAHELALGLPPTHALRADLARVDALVALGSGDAITALDHVRNAAERVVGTISLFTVGVRAAADVAVRARTLRLEPDTEAATRDGHGLAERGRALGPARNANERAHLALLAAEEARLEDPTAAEPWRDALAAWDGFGAGPSAAYASFRLAEALAAARVPAADLRAAVLDALARARRLLLTPLEAEIDAFARERRIGTRSMPANGPDADALAETGLTPRELDVLRGLLAGKTNRQIAADLFISDKTAGHHVSRILGKLGVHTRGEAAATARRLGLTEAEA